jgi:hypothetical protein
MKTEEGLMCMPCRRRRRRRRRVSDKNEFKIQNGRHLFMAGTAG